MKNPPSAPNLQRNRATSPLCFFKKTRGAGRLIAMPCQLQDSQWRVEQGTPPAGIQASSSSVTSTPIPRFPLGSSSGKWAWCAREHYSGLEGKALAMKHCVLPLETSRQWGRKHCSTPSPWKSHMHHYLPASCPATSTGLSSSLFCTEQASWKDSPGIHQLNKSFTSPSDD